MPISWRGTLAQYAGRLHRPHAAKREVVIFDYVDGHEPLLAEMATRREAGYRALGYEVINAGDLFSRETVHFVRKGGDQLTHESHLLLQQFGGEEGGHRGGQCE